jgi:hypothetical protein
MGFGPNSSQMGGVWPRSHRGAHGSHLADPGRVCSPLVDCEHRLNIYIYIYIYMRQYSLPFSFINNVRDYHMIQ